MLRFVILEHDYPELHWDLLLEAGSVLRAWRLSAPPASGQCLPAQTSFDHRLVYLDYEGPISGGRGSVRRWDAGSFCFERQEPESMEIRLDGQRLQGTLTLALLQGSRWECRFDRRAPLERSKTCP